MGMDTRGLAFPKSSARVLVKARKQADAAAVERACRKALKLRDCGLCRVCDKPSKHLHHLTLRSKGGKWLTSNIVALCVRCHQARHGSLLSLSGDPNVSVYWEWHGAYVPRGVKLWGVSRPPADPMGPGDRFHGRLPT